MEKLREKNEELAVHLNETKQKLRNTKFSLVEARRENETLIEENLNLRSKVNSYDAKMHHFRGLAATIVRQAEHLSNILEISADNPPVELVASRTQNGMVNSLQPVLLLERVNLQIDDNFGNTNKENVPDPILIKVEVEEDEPNIVVDNSPVKIPLAEAASVVPLVEAASVGKYVKKRKSVELPVKVRETRSKSKSKVVGDEKPVAKRPKLIASTPLAKPKSVKFDDIEKTPLVQSAKSENVKNPAAAPKKVMTRRNTKL